MKRLSFALLLICFGWGTLSAQDRLGDRVENNLKLLGRKIEQIRVLAERYENQEALKTIESARQDFDEAVDLLQQWKDNRQRLGLLEQARSKYQSANLKADLASRILLFKPAANLLNQLELLIRQAETVAQGSDASDLRYYLNKARNYYKHAQDAFADNRYLRGHEYLKIATYFAEKVISMAGGNNPASDRRGRFEEHRNNIQMLLNRVTVDVEDNDILQELYDNVNEYLIRAANAYASGNLNRAYSDLQIAERLTHRIIDLSEEENTYSMDKRVEEEYLSLSRYLSTLRNEYEREDRQSEILEKAEEFHLKARRNIDNREFQLAAGNLKLAQRMAQRAFNRLSANNRNTDSGNLDNRIKEVAHLLDLQSKRVESEQNKSVNMLHNQAREFFQAGQLEYEKGNFSKAAYYLNITLRLLNRNEKLLQKSIQPAVSPQEILRDLDKAEQLIGRLKLNTTLENAVQARISVLEMLLKKARDIYDSKDYLIAQEMTVIIQNQLANLSGN